MWTATPLALLLMSTTAFAVGPTDPCRDNDPGTPCCPLENMKVFEATLSDWYACTQTIPPTPLPLEPPAGAQR
ncbi:MAG TPA: hypothetical protein VFH78_03815 [Candidatus Thermoplasmatota archaeon]|nr:hypothetical protein [Candidatus Thermoplasmatota archaeon]